MDRLSSKGQMIDQIDLRSVPHSGFDRSNHNYGTGKLGTLIPVRLDEVYPGDRIKGKPEMVVNFEPLAAPLMGNLVLKQESFFVPYILLWRHAYKFFTGKNGFNDPMPCISPRQIFDIYVNKVHSQLWTTIGTDSATNKYGFGKIVDVLKSVYQSTTNQSFSSIYGKSFYNAFKELVTVQLKATMQAVYGSRKMYDLVMPIIKLFEDFQESETCHTLAQQLEDPNNDLKKVAIEAGSSISHLIRQYFDFFHGPSSLFDYLGWPVPVDLDFMSEPYAFPIPEYGVKDEFDVCVFKNITRASNDPILPHIQPYFSNIPLVFNPFKAYYLVWYWNYRDQLLETGILDPEEDEFLGSTITENIVLYCTLNRQRCWYKDTFTTALTNTGDGNLVVPTQSPTEQIQYSFYDDDGQLTNTVDHREALAAGATYCKVTNGSITYKIPMNYLGVPNTQLSSSLTDQSTSSYLSLDVFDRIRRLRSYVQKRLILGYEVDDVIWSSFMVKLTNVRMHIPELLGRGRDAVQINTIVNNTSTAEQIAGDKTATAWAHGQQSEMDYFSEEWGLFLTISTIMPIQSYSGGMQRLYLKRDPLDYFWPEFATMGMDAIYNTELAAVGTRLRDDQGMMVFGYQGRYYDLKSRMDEEHGRLLTDLNYLTFSREWDKDNPPKLNYIFVHCWPRLDGFVIDSPLVDLFRYDCYNAHAWERRLPVPSEIVS